MRNIGFKRVKKGLCGALGVLLCASLVGSAAFYENGSTVSAQTATDGGASTATVSGSSNGKVNETALSSKEAENAFLQANDEIWVIGTLNGDGLISYAEKANMPLADYAATGKGKHKVNSMIAEQQQAVRSLGSAVLETKYNYTTVFNGVSMKIRYKDLKKLEESGYFKSVIISESYAVPDAVTENVVNVWEDTGIYKTEGVTSYTGQGTVIAVLDTGLDYTHSAFAMSNFPNLDTDNLALTYDDVQAKAETLEAAKTTAGLDADDVYISYKVPYAYDYADKDTDVYPNEDHGTHVAGIIGGKDDVITGVAVNSQLAIFKVFSNHKSGAETADILAAISDAVLLGVDAINMSLGTSCGFSREEDEENVNEIYDLVRDAGICLIVAASNDYSSAYNSKWGNTNLASNPDSGTMGSPASYDASMAVASISGVKSNYLIADGEESIYFKESSTISGDQKHFVAELLGDKEEEEYEYVVIPGTGEPGNYVGYDVAGKIAVVKRGVTNFEDKVLNAQEAGAVACIIYNNVSGVISMSIGKSKLPSCSVTMDVGKYLEAHQKGKITVSKKNLAGPFMSDFSSWGVLPDLELKPDITAHGGEIYSAVREGYDHLSGTSMACPNMAGAIILIRQHVKESFPGLSPVEVTELTYRLAMSTATIAYNEVGNPYSPRKQGSGLADIGKAVSTDAYLYVEGENKTKLSLGDDPEKNGVYNLTFNLKNTGTTARSYKINPIVMTESMSSDEITVAEQAYMIEDSTYVYNIAKVAGVGGSINGNSVVVAGLSDVRITVQVILSDAARAYLDKHFANGMYVEGYVELLSQDKGGVNLNIPYLAFYGDWAQAPLLDVSAYEVGAEAVDTSILPEDKLTATIYGTLPMGAFMSQQYNGTEDEAYWGMGQTAYSLADGYEDPAILEDKAALTQNIEGMYALKGVSAGLLRGAKRVEITIKDAYTGEVVFETTDFNARKAYGASGFGGFIDVGFNANELALADGRKFTFDMVCFLDGEYGNRPNNKNTFSFSFYIDNQAPVLVPESTVIRVDTDSNGNITNRYLDLGIYDNRYLQGVFLATYETLNEKGEAEETTSLFRGMVPTPDFVKSSVNSVRINITKYWSQIQENGGKLCVTAVDYAMNSTEFYIDLNDYVSEVTGLSFRGSTNYTVKVNGQQNLKGNVVIEPRGVLTDSLEWKSSDESVATVKDGIVTGVGEGTATITVLGGKNPESGEPYSASVNVTVKGNQNDITISGIELSDVSRNLVVGETITVQATVKPYNTTQSYELVWGSTSSRIKVVPDPDDQTKATITALESTGRAVNVTVGVRGKTIQGSVAITVLEEYEVENRQLRRYNGRGDINGVVDIPDDLGIITIYDAAFLNNDYIKKVIIPEGVKDITQVSFYGCENLEEVILPETCKSLGLFSFAWNPNLKYINLENVVTVGELAFYNCPLLGSDPEKPVDLSHIAYMGSRAFAMCNSFETIDISNVKYMDQFTFAQCESLENIITSSYTQIGYMAFINCNSLKSVVLNGSQIGDYAFANCKALTSVVFNADINILGSRAFSDCSALYSVKFNGTVNKIDSYAFINCASLTEIRLPDGLTSLGAQVFGNCSQLKSVVISADAPLVNIGIAPFMGCDMLESFTVEGGSKYLQSQGGILFDKGMKTLLLFPNALALESDSFTVPETVEKIGDHAFSGIEGLKNINLSNVKTLGEGAFMNSSLQSVSGFENVKTIGGYAFYATKLNEIIIPENAEYIGNNAYSQITPADGSPEKYTLIIPAKVKHLGEAVFVNSLGFNGFIFECDLEEIPYGTFGYCDDITEITAQSFGSVKKIGDLAFIGCEGLTKVDFTGSKVTEISYASFRECKNLIDLVLTSSFKALPEHAFAFTGLTRINLPSTITEIGDYAFTGAPLAEIYTVTGSRTEAGMNSVITVGNYSFTNTKLSIVSAPKLTEVGTLSFGYTTDVALEDRTLFMVSMPRLEVLGSNAFFGAINMQLAQLPKLQVIGSFAFYANASLKKLELPEARMVGIMAFGNCMNLTSLSLPSATTIYPEAFRGSALATLEIPNVEEIMAGAFYGASKLETVTISKDNANFVTGEDGVIYRVLTSGKFEAVALPHAATVKEIVLKENTVRVEDFAFANNKSITSVTFPDTVVSIGVSAFADCTSLKNLIMNCVVAPTLECEFDEEKNLTYNNFVGGFGEELNITITVPTNAQGYDAWIWQNYLGSVTIRTNDIRRHANTIEVLEFIDSLDIDALGANDYARVTRMNRIYNLLDNNQKAYVTEAQVAKLQQAVDKVSEFAPVEPSIPDTPETPVEPDTPSDDKEPEKSGCKGGGESAFALVALALAAIVTALVVKAKRGNE